MLIARSRLLVLLAVGILLAPGILAYDAVHSDSFQPSYVQTCGGCHPRGGQDEPALEDWWSLRPDIPANLSARRGTVEVGLGIDSGFQQEIRGIDAALDLSSLEGAAGFEGANSTFTREIDKSGTGPGDRTLRAPAPVIDLEMTFRADSTGPHWNLSVRRDGREVSACGTGPNIPPATERTCQVSWTRPGSTPNETGSWQLVVALSPVSSQFVDAGGWSISGTVTHRTPVTVQHRNSQSGGVTPLGPGESQRVPWNVRIRDPADVRGNASIRFDVTAEFHYDHDGDGTCSGYPDCATASGTLRRQLDGTSSDPVAGAEGPGGGQAPLAFPGPAGVVVGVAAAALVTYLGRRRRDR